VSGLLEIEILNRQRRAVVDSSGVGPLLQSAWNSGLAAAERLTHTVTVCLVSDRKIRELNSKYRDTDSATDVLSFPDGEQSPDGETLHLGDIVVSIQTAERQAGDRGVTLERELLILALHGFLHLLGFDHETDDGQMMALQSRLEAKYVTTPIGDAT